MKLCNAQCASLNCTHFASTGNISAFAILCRHSSSARPRGTLWRHIAHCRRCQVLSNNRYRIDGTSEFAVHEKRRFVNRHSEHKRACHLLPQRIRSSALVRRLSCHRSLLSPNKGSHHLRNPLFSMDSSNGQDLSTSTPQSETDSWFSIQTTTIRQETKVCNQLPCARDDMHYNMNHPKRGRCVILNYKHFNSHELRAREGTERDGSSLQKTFTNLNFEIETHENLSWKQTFDVLVTESNRNHESYDCFVLCILTHGSNGILHCKDRQLNTEQIFNLFTANRCRTLVGKPKLFFIQACQGEMFDSGTLVHDSPVSSPGYFLIPNYADFLIFYSTYPGHFSWRNSSRGSWFMESLCQVLEKYHEKYDLMTMLTIVCRTVAFEYQSNVPNNPDMDRKKQIPCIMSTLTRLIQF